MTSNHTRVCFDCRTSVRRPSYSGYRTPICVECGKEMNWIFRYWRIPKKKDLKAWNSLRQKRLGVDAEFYHWDTSLINGRRRSGIKNMSYPTVNNKKAWRK